MPDQPGRDPRYPDWPVPELRRAAESHWDDAARLRLIAQALGRRTDPGARDLEGRVAARLRDLDAAAPRPRVIRRDPAFLARAKAAPLPREPTPEMATLLRQLELERASGESARKEAAMLRQRLLEQRTRRLEAEAAPGRDRELQAARAEARAAREEAARLAERLAFVSSAGRRGADPAQARPQPGSAPPRPDAAQAARPNPAYAELGLSPDLPDDIIPVLERALLRHHHPDRATPEAREAATRRFQSVQRAFDTIRRLRGLPG